jgi:hypothetical protein
MEDQMVQQEQQNSKSERFISIKKLVALDIITHGHWIILAEFAFGVFVSGAIGIFSLFNFFSNANSAPLVGIIGVILLWIALNYVPMLLYTISIMRHKSVLKEVTRGLENGDIHTRKYALQSAFLILPLLVPILAICQEVQKRFHFDR